MGDVPDKNVSISIPFSTSQFASLAYDVLSVDKELKGSGVERVLQLDGQILQVHFLAEDFKKLRVSINSFLKNVLLIVKTIDRFNQI